MGHYSLPLLPEALPASSVRGHVHVICLVFFKYIYIHDESFIINHVITMAIRVRVTVYINAVCVI